jgi:hypothetical protein
LNQMPQQQYNTVPHYYIPTQPTFLQPSFQYLGPTASGGQGTGPYGPYWHDGTFVPYRPAAVRDPRFYQHPHGGWLGSLPGPLYTPQPSPYQPSLPANSYEAQVLNANGFGAPPSYPTPLHPNSAQHIYGQIGDVVHQGQVPFPHDSMQHTPQSVGFANSNQLYHSQQQADLQEIHAEFGPSSPNGQQRDSTFVWALQQYRELLAFIHHTRRQQQAARQMDGQTHVVQRPSFYPQPPKLSRAGHSFHGSRRKSITIPRDVMEKRFRRSSDPTSGQSAGKSCATEDWDGDDVETPKARSPTMGLSTVSHPHGSEEQEVMPNHDHKVDQPMGNTPHQQERIRTLRRSSGSAVQAMSNSPPNDNSPPSRAKAALADITKLCQETGWQWTEGMHLGGCIAYGLGNYQKALKWYSKVLEQDPKHLEALSNLAATMLALGRRQEAEQNWMKVVKAAPSHFEAVEHLIGLLCTEHRSCDAIKVIEYVEANLRYPKTSGLLKTSDKSSECDSSNASRSPVV